MSSNEKITYKDAGVDISQTDALKVKMGKILDTDNKRVLNKLGAFAALYDISFDMQAPTLVLKSEEPGSKQKLAFEHGYISSICHDMINHLVNDIIVMGAKPLAVLDTIVTAESDDKIIDTLILGMKEACENNECVLIGGETSIQPGVVSQGVCVLTSSIVGIVGKNEIVDGSKIREGDAVIAISSNGVHTNGYTLIRMLMDKYPEIMNETLEDGTTFLDAIMTPHRAYYKSIKAALEGPNQITGMAHITGGGIQGNVCRILPEHACAYIDLAKIKTLPLFTLLKKYSNSSDQDMLSTFNCGVGMVLVCRPQDKEKLLESLNQFYISYEIGEIITSEEKVKFTNNILW